MLGFTQSGTSWGWWDEWDDTALQKQDLKFEPLRSEGEHATSRSRWLSTTLNFYEWAGKKHFVPWIFEARVRTRDLRLSKEAALANAPGPPPNCSKIVMYSSYICIIVISERQQRCSRVVLHTRILYGRPFPLNYFLWVFVILLIPLEINFLEILAMMTSQYDWIPQETIRLRSLNVCCSRHADIIKKKCPRVAEISATITSLRPNVVWSAPYYNSETDYNVLSVGAVSFKAGARAWFIQRFTSGKGN